MVAWMNREALKLTQQNASGVLVAFAQETMRTRAKSRAFQESKGYTSGCDGDVILLQIEQQGGIACHTGVKAVSIAAWKRAVGAMDAVLKLPSEIYKTEKSDK